jgi:hypothetical protein
MRPRLGAGQAKRQAGEQACGEIARRQPAPARPRAARQIGAAQATVAAPAARRTSSAARPDDCAHAGSRDRCRAAAECRKRRLRARPGQLQALAQFLGQGLGQVADCQCLADQLLQRRIGQPCGRRINRGQFRSAAASSSATCGKRGCTISAPKKPPRTSPKARIRAPSLKRRLLAGIKTEKTQRQLPALIAARTTICRRGR